MRKKELYTLVPFLLTLLILFVAESAASEQLRMIKEKTEKALSNSLFMNETASYNDSSVPATDNYSKESTIDIENSMISKTLRSVLILASVLALAILTLYLIKCYLFGKNKLGSSQKLILRKDSLYLAPKKSISLIEIAGQWLIIGITPTTMTTLAQIEAPPQTSYEKTGQKESNEKNNSNFRYVLKNLQNNLSSLKKV